MYSSDGAAIAYSPLGRTEAQAVDKSQSTKCECCHCKSKPAALTPEQEAADIKRWAEGFNQVFGDRPQSEEAK